MGMGMFGGAADGRHYCLGWVMQRLHWWYISRWKTQCTNHKTATTPLWKRDAQGQPPPKECGLFFVSIQPNVSSDWKF